MLGGEVADGFVQADHPLLHDVVAIGADQEVRTTLDPGKAAVPGEQLVDSLFVSGPKQRHEVLASIMPYEEMPHARIDRRSHRSNASFRTHCSCHEVSA